MSKYIKKPVVIEAFKYRQGTNALNIFQHLLNVEIIIIQIVYQKIIQIQ